MHFIELPSFTNRVRKILDADAYRQLQNELIERPDRGALIPGGSGLRKARVAVEGRGKRGGGRVIYYWFVRDDEIFFLDIYAKSKKSDLTKAQLKELVAILNQLKQ